MISATTKTTPRSEAPSDENPHILGPTTMQRIFDFCNENGFDCEVEGKNYESSATEFAAVTYNEEITVTFSDGPVLSLHVQQVRADWMRSEGDTRWNGEVHYSIHYDANGVDVDIDGTDFARYVRRGLTKITVNNLSKPEQKFKGLLETLGNTEAY